MTFRSPILINVLGICATSAIVTILFLCGSITGVTVAAWTVFDTIPNMRTSALVDRARQQQPQHRRMTFVLRNANGEGENDEDSSMFRGNKINFFFSNSLPQPVASRTVPSANRAEMKAKLISYLNQNDKSNEDAMYGDTQKSADQLFSGYPVATNNPAQKTLLNGRPGQSNNVSNVDPSNNDPTFLNADEYLRVSSRDTVRDKDKDDDLFSSQDMTNRNEILISSKKKRNLPPKPLRQLSQSVLSAPDSPSCDNNKRSQSTSSSSAASNSDDQMVQAWHALRQKGQQSPFLSPQQAASAAMEMRQAVFAEEEAFLKQSDIFREGLVFNETAFQEAAIRRKEEQNRERKEEEEKARKALYQHLDEFMAELQQQQSQQSTDDRPRCSSCRCLLAPHEIQYNLEKQKQRPSSSSLPQQQKPDTFGAMICQFCYADQKGFIEKNKNSSPSPNFPNPWNTYDRDNYYRSRPSTNDSYNSPYRYRRPESASSPPFSSSWQAQSRPAWTTNRPQAVTSTTLSSSNPSSSVAVRSSNSTDNTMGQRAWATNRPSVITPTAVSSSNPSSSAAARSSSNTDNMMRQRIYTTSRPSVVTPTAVSSSNPSSSAAARSSSNTDNMMRRRIYATSRPSVVTSPTVSSSKPSAAAIPSSSTDNMMRKRIYTTSRPSVVTSTTVSLSNPAAAAIPSSSTDNLMRQRIQANPPPTQSSSPSRQSPPSQSPFAVQKVTPSPQEPARRTGPYQARNVMTVRYSNNMDIIRSGSSRNPTTENKSKSRDTDWMHVVDPDTGEVFYWNEKTEEMRWQLE